MAGMFGLFSDKKKKNDNAQQGPQPQGGLQGASGVNAAQAGAALRTDADADTEEALNQYIAGQKATAFDPLVADAKKKLIANLEAKMGKVLTAKKADILKHAQTEMKKNLGGRDHTGDLNADTLLGESNAWEDAMAVAKDQATALVTPEKVTELKTAGEAEFVYQGDGALKKSQRAKHLAKATAAAKTAIDDAMKTIEAALTLETNKVSTKNALVAQAQAKADTTMQTDAAEDLTQRDANNAKLETAVQAPVDAMAKTIKDDELEKAKDGLGAKGMGWFSFMRSAEFKAFHNKMKASAREKGHDETDKAIGAQRTSGVAANQKAQFEYQTLQAHKATHKEAKMELREVMADLAAEVLTKADGEVKTSEKLMAAATAAGWNALREDPAAKKSETAATKAATSAVKGAKAKVQETLHTKAKALVDAYIQKGGEAEAGSAETRDQVLDKKVDDKIRTEEKDGAKFGKRMITQAIDAPTASKGLQRVGALIDATTPQPGDETELAVELKIPASHGAFVYFTVTGTAARSKHMEVGVEIGFGAGWETWGLSARGGFNVFLKAGAADTVTAMQMIHYGAFRNLTHVNHAAANFWTGAVDPNETGVGDKKVGKNEQAELWAAATEERAFTKDPKAFVEVGGGGGASAKLKAGIGGEVSAKLTSARRWDKDVMDKAGGAGNFGDRDGKTEGERDTLAMDKRQRVIDNVKRVNKFKFGTSIEAEANGQKFSLGVEAERTGKPAGEVGADWQIQITGGIPYDASSASSSTMLSKIAGSYVPAAISGVKKIYDAYKAKTAPTEEGGGDGAGRIAGGVMDAGEDLTIGLDAGGMTNNLLKSLSEANPQQLATSQAEGVNDTARLWLGNSAGLKGAMGDAGDMTKKTSEIPGASPFGVSSQLQVVCVIEKPEGGPAKVTFKVVSAKEMKMGGDLGAGVGLSGKLTRKQELAGFSLGGDTGPQAWSGGRAPT